MPAAPCRTSSWTNGFDPSKKPNFRKLIAALRGHDIPDVWPVGKPPATLAAATKRPKTTWENQGGHYAHGQIRGQSHWDPGAIDTDIVKRLKRANGHLAGVVQMIEDGRSCLDIAQQLHAVEKAIAHHIIRAWVDDEVRFD